MTFNIGEFVLGVLLGVGSHALGQIAASWWMRRVPKVVWPQSLHVICACQERRQS